MKQQVSTFIDECHFDDLRKIANDRNVSIYNLLNHIIVNFLKEQKNKGEKE